MSDDTARTGRPAIGPKIQVRLTDDTIARLDARATAKQVDRSELIRRFVAAGLASGSYGPPDIPSTPLTEDQEIADLLRATASYASTVMSTINRLVHESVGPGLTPYDRPIEPGDRDILDPHGVDDDAYWAAPTSLDGGLIEQAATAAEYALARLAAALTRVAAPYERRAEAAEAALIPDDAD